MSAFAGTSRLVRLMLRRDRFLMLAWIVLLATIPIGFVSAFTGLYPTEAARQELVRTTGLNPVFTAFYGPLPNSSIGSLVSWRAGIVPVVVGVISLFTVIRHSRTEEETGRGELLGSTIIGRQAGLAAALAGTIGANLVLSLLVAVGMISQKLPTAGSFALGLQYAAVGSVFAAIAAVAAQLAARAGAARALALAALGLAFVLRVAGDVSSFTWLSWLSPLGWAERIRPFANERWWIFAPLLMLVAGSALVAAKLLSRRDLGAGILPSRPGPAAAPSGLRSPLALAWRLHRSLLIGSAIGFALFGAALGGFAASISDLLKDNPQLQDIIAHLGGNAGIVDAFFAGIMSVLALMVAVYCIHATLRMQSEEIALRGELVLAASVGRRQWAMSHLTISGLGSAILMASAGLAAGLVHGLNAHDLANQVPRVLASAAIQLPAISVLLGITFALFGLVPRLTGMSWGALGVFILLGQLGAALRLPQWTLDLSPFTHVPKVLGGEFTAIPLVIMIGLAALLGLIGFAGLKHRDFGRVQ
jgi:ABC-2 type transport system permease protein